MSIRCNEFSMPAAIRLEKKFQLLTKNNNLYLNCKKNIVRFMKKIGIVPTIIERRKSNNLIVDNNLIVF